MCQVKWVSKGGYLMGRDISLQKLVLLQQVVDRGQILPIILRREKSFNLQIKSKMQKTWLCAIQRLTHSLVRIRNRSHLRQPEVEVLYAGVEVLLLVGLLQFLTFLSWFIYQELPLFIQSHQTRLGIWTHTHTRTQLSYSLMLQHCILIVYKVISFLSKSFMIYWCVYGEK